MRSSLVRMTVWLACLMGAMGAGATPLSGSDPHQATQSGPGMAVLGLVHVVPSPNRFDAGLDPSLGREIQSIQPGSTAQAMGLQQGDVIVGINGLPVVDGMSMRHELVNSSVGDPINLVVWRDGNEVALSGKLGPGNSKWRFGDLESELDSEREYRSRQRDRINTELQDYAENVRLMEDLLKQVDALKQGLSVQDLAGKTSDFTAGITAWILRWRMDSRSGR